MKQALAMLMAIMFLVGATVSTGWAQSGSNVKSFTKQKNRSVSDPIKKKPADHKNLDVKKPTQPARKPPTKFNTTDLK
jgi:hypothetical protein